MIRRIAASKRTVFLSCLLVSTILLLMPQPVTSKLQFSFQRLFHVPLRFGRSVTLSALTPANPAAVSPEDLKELRQQNRQLQNHIANLQALIRQQQQEINRQARRSLEGQWERMSFVPADVITAVGDDQLLINRGSADGVFTGCFALSNNAIVGRIRALTAYRAKMRLVSDRGSLLRVYIGSPDIEGVLKGMGQGRMIVSNVPYNQPVEPNLPVYIRKHPGYLEMPIIVGTVSDCHPDEHDPHLWKIEIRPAANIRHLLRVDVIAPVQS